jgi:hypothetical protein
MKRELDSAEVDVLDVLSSVDKSSSSYLICYQVLGWLVVHEGVLPVHLKQPKTSAQFAERILRVELDYLKVQTDQPAGVSALLREVNRISSHEYPAKQLHAVPSCCFSSEESRFSELAAPKRRRLLTKTKVDSSGMDVFQRSVDALFTKERALEQRVIYGNIFYLLRLLRPFLCLSKVYEVLPVLFTYSGFDCSLKWATYLGAPALVECMTSRLSDALGVTDEEVSVGRERLDNLVWSFADVVGALDEICLHGITPRPRMNLLGLFCEARVMPSEEVSPTLCSEQNPVKEHLLHVTFCRPCHDGSPGYSAMPARLRKPASLFERPTPALLFACKMCDAEFPNKATLVDHKDMVHGGCRCYSDSLCGLLEVSPYVHDAIDGFAICYQCASVSSENEPYQKEVTQPLQRILLWAHVFRECASVLFMDNSLTMEESIAASDGVDSLTGWLAVARVSPDTAKT